MQETKPKIEVRETLFLILKKQWYDLIESGKKTREYRDLTMHYESRFYRKKYRTVVFSNGYAEKDRKMRWEIVRVVRSVAQNCYVIYLGKRLPLGKHDWRQQG